MSKIKNGGLDQYGVEPCRQQQFGTAGIEGVRWNLSHVFIMPLRRTEMVFKVIRNPVTTTKFWGLSALLFQLVHVYQCVNAIYTSTV